MKLSVCLIEEKAIQIISRPTVPPVLPDEQMNRSPSEALELREGGGCAESPPFGQVVPSRCRGRIAAVGLGEASLPMVDPVSFVLAALPGLPL